MGGFAWVTLATNDSYSLGALVLAHSLKKANTAHKMVVLITPSVSQPMREHLQTVFDQVKLVEVLDSKDEAHLALLKRPELGITFTKIHCWRLTEFDKCVFLDADTLVVRNCDELFEREELSAAPDFSWPDCFNSGVFVFKPSVETFDKILQFAVEKGSFDGGDQGLLNQFFGDWATEDIKKHLPFTYNLSSLAAYSYIPAFKQYGSETRIVHFIGTGKPWLQKLDPATKTITPTPGAEHLGPLLQQWWDLFCEKVHPNLDKNLSGIAGAIAQLNLESSEATAASSSALQEYVRRQNWETGNMDYMGRDSFDNIWAKICQTLEGKEAEEAAGRPAEPQPPTAAPVDQQQPQQPPAAAVPQQQPSVPPTEAPQPQPTAPVAAVQQQPATVPPQPQPTAPAAQQPSLPPTEATPPQPAAPQPQPTAPAAQQPPLAPSEATPPQPAVPAAAQQQPQQPSLSPQPIAPKTEGAAAPSETLQTKPSDSEFISTLPSEPPVRSVEEDDIIFSKPQEPPQPALTHIKEEEEALAGKTPTTTPVGEVKTEVSATVPAVPASGLPSTTPQIVRTPATPVTAEVPPTETAPTVAAKEAVPGAPPAAPTVSAATPAVPTVPGAPPAAPTVPGAPPTAPTVPGKEDPPAGTPATAPIPAGPDAAPGAQTAAGTSAPVPGVAGKEEVPPGLPSTALMVFNEAQAGNVKLSDILEPKKEGPQSSEGKPAEAGSEEGKQSEPSTPIPMPPIPEPSAAPGEKKTKSAPRVEHAQTESDPSQSENQSSSARTSRSDSLKDDGKQKKGVFTKILEIVGVAPKTKKENGGDVSKSVFYDVEGAVPAQEKDEGVSKPSEKPEGDKPQTEEPAKIPELPEKAEPSPDESKVSKPSEGVVVESKKEEPVPETKQETKQEVPAEGEKSKNKAKPARNLKGPAAQVPGAKNKSSSPKLSMPSKQEHVPETAVTVPTPPVVPDVPKERRDSSLLKVDETVLETPPVPDPTKPSGPLPETPGPEGKGTVKSEIEDILGKAKSEVESRLQAVEQKSAELQQAAEGETSNKEVSELINTMKLIVGDDEAKDKGKSKEQTKPRRKSTDNKQQSKKSPPKKEEIEELKVTTPEERQKHKGEVTSSKLSDQILKAIPPPRRKAISESKSEASPSTGAIPKTNPLEAVPPEEKNISIVTDKPAEDTTKPTEGTTKPAEGTTKPAEGTAKPAEGSTKPPGGKQTKPSVPVPPPRSKSKPSQPAPKGKKK